MCVCVLSAETCTYIHTYMYIRNRCHSYNDVNLLFQMLAFLSVVLSIGVWWIIHVHCGYAYMYMYIAPDFGSRVQELKPLI